MTDAKVSTVSKINFEMVINSLQDFFCHVKKYVLTFCLRGICIDLKDYSYLLARE